MNDLVEINNRLKIRIKQLEATINLCEIKIKENEQNLCKKSNQVIGRESEIIHLKTNQNQMQDELKKLQLQNKIMNNELNNTLSKSFRKSAENLHNVRYDDSLNKFITFNRKSPQFNKSTNNLDMFAHHKKINKKTEFIRKINVINK